MTARMRWWAVGLVCAIALGAAAQTPGKPTRAQVLQRAALERFEVALHKEVAQRWGTPAVRWRETIVPPDPAHLMWGEKTTRVPGALPYYRAALDPRTRWYYVTRTVGERPPQYFGPIDEVGDGVYKDVFVATPAPSGAAAARSP